MATFDSFHEIQFPTTISYEAKSGPSFSTRIQTHRSGHEGRVSEWEKVRRRFAVSHSGMTEQRFDTVLNFFYARKGRFFGFRLQDPTDYKANRDGVTAQTLGTGTGVLTTFQLIKTYGDAGGSYIYTVYKPCNNSTLKVYVNSVLKTSPGDYTIDYTSGIITFTSAPPLGHVVAAYYEYDVPARFDTDVLDGSYKQFNDLNWQGIPIIEIRPRG